MKLLYIIGYCTDEELIEELFDSVSNFALLIEENGNEFEYNGIQVKYDEETDIHTFWKIQKEIKNG